MARIQMLEKIDSACKNYCGRIPIAILGRETIISKRHAITSQLDERPFASSFKLSGLSKITNHGLVTLNRSILKVRF